MKYIGIAAFILILVGAGFYLGQTYKPVPATSTTPTTQTQTQVTEAPVTTQAPVADDKTAVIAMVKASEVARVGQDANSSTYTVTQLNGIYTRGTAGGTGGGAIWLAAKVNGVWKMVFIGNGTVECSSLAPYPDFPKTMMSECWDSVNQKNVMR